MYEGQEESEPNINHDVDILEEGISKKVFLNLFCLLPEVEDVFEVNAIKYYGDDLSYC